MKSEAADGGEVEEDEEQERVEVKKEKVEKEAAMEEGEEGVVVEAEEEEGEEEEVMKETVWSSCSQRDDRSKDLTEEPLHFFGQALCASSSSTKALKEQKTVKPRPPRGPCPSPLP